MNQAQDQHPSAEQLQAFGHGRLAPGEQAAIERHIAACDACCQLLRQLPDDTLLGRLRGAPTPHDGAPTRRVDFNLGETMVPRPLRDHPRYRIIRPLGAGGMGVVYLAEHRLMQRTVALKVINSELVDDSQAVERFRQEVRAAAQLAHPNIVTAYDADQAADLHFLVMEYVEGVSLARWVEKKGPLSVLHACTFIRQAAQGLQDAAAQGMVHRDLKPQNLMLTRKGQVKILDFGLARLGRRSGPVQVADVSLPKLTAVGSVLGTPDYMAPEQASDSTRVDVRSDIYSLGCTLYFLLTGRPPFVGGSALDKMLAHVSDPVKPVTQFRQDVPAELLQVLDRMMAKHAAQRFQTPAELVQGLMPFCQKMQPSPFAEMTPAEPVNPLIFGVDEPTPRPLGAQRGGQQSGRPWLAPALAVLALTLGGIWLALVGLKKDPPPSSRPGVVADLDESHPTPASTALPPFPPPTEPDASANLPSKPTGRPRVLIVLSQRSFFWGDYAPVRDVLAKGGAAIAVASSARTDAEPAPHPGGSKVAPDLLLSEARPQDFDAVIFTGIGVFVPGAMNEFEAEGQQAAIAKAFCTAMLKAGKHVTALCGGVSVLADAGILRGREFTGPSFSGSVAADLMMAKLRKAEMDGARPLWNESVVVSDRVITGQDFKSAPWFAQTLLDRLQPERPSNPE